MQWRVREKETSLHEVPPAPIPLSPSTPKTQLGKNLHECEFSKQPVATTHAEILEELREVTW